MPPITKAEELASRTGMSVAEAQALLERKASELGLPAPRPPETLAATRQRPRLSQRISGGVRSFLGGAARGIGETAQFGAQAPVLGDLVPPLRRLKSRVGGLGTDLAGAGQSLVEAGRQEGQLGRAADVLAFAGEFADVAIPGGKALSAVRKAGKSLRRVEGAADVTEGALEAIHRARRAAPSTDLPDPDGILTRTARKLNFEFFNTFQGTSRVSRTLSKEGFQKEAKLLETQANNIRASSALMSSPMFHGITDLVSGEIRDGDLLTGAAKRFGGEPMTAWFVDGIDEVATRHGRTRQETLRDLETYVTEQRNLSLARQSGIPVGPAFSSKGRAETLAPVRPGKPRPGLRKKPIKGFSADLTEVTESQEALRLVRGKWGHDLDDLAARYREWSWGAKVEPVIQAGWLSRAEAKQIRNLGDDYASFVRAVEDQLGKARGVEFATAINEAIPIKGKVVTRSAGAKKLVPSLWEQEMEAAARIHVAAQRQIMRNMLGEAADLSPKVAREIRPLGKVKSVGKGQIAAYRNGVRLAYEAPADVQRTLDHMTPKEVHGAIKFAGSLTDLFRAGVTLTLRFGVRNILRDPFSAGILTRNGQIPFLSPARALLGEAFQRLRKGGISSKYASDRWKEFMASAGPHSGLVRLSRGSMLEELEAMGDVIRRGTVENVTRKTLRDPIYPFRVVNNAFEKPSRFTEFSLARRKGKAVAEAADDASEVTLNFLRAGRSGRMWNQFEAFANAMLQDPDRFARAMRDKPFWTAFRGFAYLTLPQIWNYQKNKDNPDWQNLPEWERVLFLHPHQRGGEGSGGRFVRIPMPPGVLTLIFSYLPQQAMRFFEGDSDLGEFAKQVTEEMIQETPLRFTPLAAFGEGEFEDFAIDLLPNALQPIGELAANRRPFFGGRPAVPERLKRLAPEDRETERTSTPARLLGRTEIGKTVGGPAAVDFLIASYLGSLGRDVATALSPAQPLSRRFPGVPEGLRGIPVVSEVASALISPSPIGFGSEPVREFYNIQARADQAWNSLQQQTSPERRNAVLADRPEARYAKHLRKVREQLSGLAELRRKAILRGEDDLMIATDMQITSVAAHAVELVKAEIEADIREGLK